MPAHAVADARPAQWRKVIFNAASNPLGALTGLTHGRVCERPDLRALVSGLIDEGKAVASAQGIDLDADPEALIDHAAKPEVGYDHKASMLQDVEARRRTEIDYLNGGIVSFGARLGVPTPLNETIAALVRGIEASWTQETTPDGSRKRARAPLRQHPRRHGRARPRRADRLGQRVLAASRAASRTSRASRSCTATPTSIVPADGEPFIVFPTEARYVGEHGTTPLEQVFADRPGAEIAARARAAGWKRIGVFGLDYIMNVRDHSALDGLDLVHFDVEFDHSRAVKSKAELESVRDSVRINQRGFEVFFDAYAPGKSAAEVMGAAEGYFVGEGCGRLTMNMVLTAPGRSGLALPEFKIARKEEILGDFLLPSLEVAGPGMHWVEVSRAVGTKDAPLTDHTKRQMEAYLEYYEAARTALRAGATCHDVHRAVSAAFTDARLPARARHRPLDRHDDDRVPEDRRGRRVRARRGHGLLDAPARDRRERRLPLHAGHVARHGERRRAAGDPADADLPQVAAVRELAGAELPGDEVGRHREVASQLLGGRRAVAGGAGREDALVLELALAHDPGALDRELAVALAVVPGGRIRRTSQSEPEAV